MRVKLFLVILFGFSNTLLGMRCGIQKVNYGRVEVSSDLVEIEGSLNVILNDFCGSDRIIGRIIGDEEALQLEIEHLDTGWKTIGEGRVDTTINLLQGERRFIMGCVE